jgi:hypothetical protein
VTGHPSTGAAAHGAERRLAGDQVAARLRRRGGRLLGHASDEELVDLLDAAERFEAVVERGGGDLLLDEPVGTRRPIAPDDGAFVLPRRDPHDSVVAYIARIAEGGAHAARTHRAR